MSMFITYEDISNEGQPPLYMIYRRSELTAMYYINTRSVIGEQALMYPTLSARYVMEWDGDAQAWWLVDTWFDDFREIGDYDFIKQMCESTNLEHLS